MNRFLLSLLFPLSLISTRAQEIAVGSRDNQYIYGECLYKGWHLKLEESVYSSKIGSQYVRLYAGYCLQNAQWSIDVDSYFGTPYNGKYNSYGCLASGTYVIQDKYHLKATINPHYDSGYKYETNFRIGAEADIFDQISIMAAYQEMPIYRMKEKRVYGGLIFKSGNLSVCPQISIPTDDVINHIRCIVNFRYCFSK
jgi:hypothetical protein